MPSEPEYSGGFQNAECDFMDVEIGRINGQVRRFPVKIMPFIHEMFQHGLGIGLLEQGAVGASGNTLVQDVYAIIKLATEASEALINNLIS